MSVHCSELAALAKEYAERGLEEGNNQAIHDAPHQYIKYEQPAMELAGFR